MEMDKQWATIRKVPLSFLHHRSGSGEIQRPLILFLHGFPDDPSVWLEMSRHLKDQFDLLLPYVGRVGNPKLPKNRLKLSRLAMDMINLIQSLYQDERPILIVAHDLGGAIARELEFMLGDRIKGVIYINSMGSDVFANRLKDPSQIAKSYYMLAFQFPLFSPRLIQRFHAPLDKRFSKFGRLAPPAAEAKNVWQGIELYRSFIGELTGALREKRKSAIPALFVFGNKDPFIVLPKKSDLNPFYNQFQIRVLESGHWPQTRNSEKLAKIVERFFYDECKSVTAAV
jgi:pimeloyl-ACP methyl ester carboxylesterase